MKIKTAVITVLAGFISLGANAQVFVTNSIDSAKMVNGFMNVSELPENGGGFVFASGWGVPDLSAYFNGAGNVVTNVPNSIGDPNEFWYQNTSGTATPPDVGGPGQKGNKTMEANLFGEDATGLYASKTLVFEADVTSYSLSNTHSVIAFIKDFSSDFSDVTEVTVPITTTGKFSISKPISSDTTRVIQWGIQMTGPNVWVTDLAPFGNVVIEGVDDNPPTPNPMEFEVVPFTVSDNSISMTASNATDGIYGVEYLFTNTVNGTSSGWQSDPTYLDTGLNPGTLYTYQVFARDTSPSFNTTAPSAPESATTSGADEIPPSPAMMAINEADSSSVSIKLVASTATDPSGVEYYFYCTSGGPGGNDSGWQSSPVYVDEGLSNNTVYTYTVIARDLSAAQNSNTVSDAVDVMTASTPGTVSFSNSLQGFSGDSTQAETRHELAKAGLVAVSSDAGKTIEFDSSGAKFGEGATPDNRNILRTFGLDYGDYDFEISATFITSNTSEQAAFIGSGPGIIGAFGLPDFLLEGVYAFVGEAQGAWTKLFSLTNGVVEVETNVEPGLTTVTNRMKMIHDTTAETVTLEIDTDYDGTFVADLIRGPHATSNVWVDAEQRVYIGAGAGVVYKDLEIIVTGVPAVTFDVELQEADPGVGTVLNWQGVFGQVYELQYTTDLVNGTWVEDTTVGGDITDSGAAMESVTSTVDEDQVFYRFILK